MKENIKQRIYLFSYLMLFVTAGCATQLPENEAIIRSLSKHIKLEQITPEISQKEKLREDKNTGMVRFQVSGQLNAKVDLFLLAKKDAVEQAFKKYQIQQTPDMHSNPMASLFGSSQFRYYQPGKGMVEEAYPLFLEKFLATGQAIPFTAKFEALPEGKEWELQLVSYEIGEQENSVDPNRITLKNLEKPSIILQTPEADQYFTQLKQKEEARKQAFRNLQEKLKQDLAAGKKYRVEAHHSRDGHVMETIYFEVQTSEAQSLQDGETKQTKEEFMAFKGFLYENKQANPLNGTVMINRETLQADIKLKATMIGKSYGRTLNFDYQEQQFKPTKAFMGEINHVIPVAEIPIEAKE